MAVDTSSYAEAAGAPKSLSDYQQQYQGIAQNALNLQASRQKLDAYTQDQAEKQSLRNYLASSPDLSTASGYNGLMAAAPTMGPGIHKTYQDSLTSQALASKDTAQAGQYNAETDTKKYELARTKLDRAMQMVSQSPTPDAAKQHLSDLVQHGLMTVDDANQKAQEIDQASAQPGGYNQWRLGSMAQLMSAHDQFEANKPTLGTRNTGSTLENTATNPMTGVPTVMATTPLQATPGEVLSARTSRANNADTIASENARAGVTPGGAMDDNSERTAQAIAAGQLPAPTGMALLNPKNQRMLGRVMEINPAYDATTVSAKKAAATAFTSGPLGNQLRSFSTAGEHLDQLGTLIDALDNGQNQTVNKIGNAVATWNGSTPVTSFDAAKDVVAKEVMKAIVAGGGGQSEREELSKSLSSANSPQQLKGVVHQYRNLMGAQAANLMEQRRAAGLPDSTLPHYGSATGAPAAAAAPTGFKITHVDGQPQ